MRRPLWIHGLVLWCAAPVLLWRQVGEVNDLSVLDLEPLAGFYLPRRSGSDDVQRAGLRAQHPPVTHLAHHERPEAAGIHDGMGGMGMARS